MADYGVADAYGRLAETIMRGAGDIGATQIAERQMGLKEKEAQVELDRFKRFTMPKLQEEERAIQYRAQPVNVMDGAPADELGRMHYATNLAPRVAGIFGASADPETGYLKYAKPLDPNNPYVTRGDWEREGPRVAAAMLNATNLGYKYGDDLATAEAELAAAEAAESKVIAAPGLAGATVNPTGSGEVSLANAAAANGQGGEVSLATLAAGGIGLAKDAGAVALARKKVDDLRAKVKAYQDDPLPFEEKKLSRYYELRNQNIQLGLGEASLKGIDFEISKAEREVERLRAMPGSDRETKTVGYWSRLLPPEAAKKFVEFYGGDVDKQVNRAEARETGSSMDAMIKAGNDKKTVKSYMAEYGLSGAERDALGKRYDDPELILDRKVFESALADVRGLNEKAAENAEWYRRQRVTVQGQKEVQAHGSALNIKEIRARETARSGGVTGGGKLPKAATKAEWKATVYALSPEQAADFDKMFPGGDDTVVAATAVKARFEPWVKQVLKEEERVGQAWYGLDPDEQAMYGDSDEFAKQTMRKGFRFGEYGGGQGKKGGGDKGQGDYVPQTDFEYDLDNKRARAVVAMRLLPKAQQQAWGKKVLDARRLNDPAYEAKIIDEVLSAIPAASAAKKGYEPVKDKKGSVLGTKG